MYKPKALLLLFGTILNFLIFSFPSSILAQQSKPANDITQLVSALDTFNKQLPVEKLFIHTDKSSYVAGDTIWFKGYLLNGATGAYSSRSGLVYVELISDSSMVAHRICIPASFGLTWGQLILDESITEGAYTLRAYTNWMQNFDEDYFFKKRFYIGSANPNQWLVTENHQSIITDGKQQVNFGLQFKKQNNDQIGFKEIQWRVLDGQKTLAKKTEETLNSRIEGNFVLSNNSKKAVTIIAQDKSNATQSLKIPLNLSEAEDMDIQFLPEGGHLVAELPNRVGFKALLPNGKGVDVSGIIVDSRNNQVVDFESVYKGMGAFDFTPEPNEKYTAQIKIANGKVINYPLPQIQPSGTTLKVVNNPLSDSLKVFVFFSQNQLSNTKHRLIGLSKGTLFYAAEFNSNRQRVSINVPKQQFPTGVAHFTVFNENNQPLTERATYIDRKDNLQVQIEPQRASFNLRDSIALNLKVTRADGRPVLGSFSLAVTDDSQVNTDTLQENLLSYFYLSSELKGKIESPAYYFNGTPEAHQALDLLLLTQGWVGYNWTEIFKPKNPIYAAEKELTVNGKATTAFNKPVAKSGIVLWGKGKVSLLRDTVTNEAGRFSFANFPRADTISFFVQARNARNRSFNIGLELETFKPARPVPSNEFPLVPWYVNSDTTTLNLLKNKNIYKQYIEKLNGSTLLKDVVITAKKHIKNSKNLNGPGEADQIIDEEQIRKAGGFYSVIDLLQKQIKGFNIRASKTGDLFYYLHDKKLRFIVDGIDLDRFYEQLQNDEGEDSSSISVPKGINEYHEYINSTLSSVSPADIVGIEVMYNFGNTANYDTQFLELKERLGSTNMAYLEITTRSGNGIFARSTPGTATYRPIPLTFAKQFYRPRYQTNSVTTPDYRSTIHWQPHVYVNKEGIATTSFYSADKPGKYTVIVQGSNMEGSLGYKVIKLTIEKPKENK